MDENDRKRLIGNHKYLVDNLEVDEISDYLYGHGILNPEEKEEIDTERTSFRAARKLLRILPKKGPTAYKLFRDSLEKSSSISFIVEKLDCTDCSTLVISDAAFDQEDKIAQLQHQMCMQTELLMKYKQDKDNLEKRLKENEQQTQELKVKYGDFEKTVEEQGISKGEAFEYLKDYLNNKDVPDFSFQYAPSPVPSPSKILFNPTPTFEFSMGDIKANSETLCEAIARDLGKDSVRYMVQSTIKSTKVNRPSSSYSATMRKLTDELVSQHEEVFSCFIVKLQMDQINGYDTFVKVADEIFAEGENNWGRVVVLYAFAGWMARHAAENGNEKMAMFMGDFLGFYVVRKLGDWIQEQGGWDAFLERFGEASEKEDGNWKKWLFAAVGIAGASALVGIVAAQKS